jgi:hypothetical protein
MDNDDLKVTLMFIKECFPDLDWMISQINNHEGSLGFPKRFIDLFTYDGLSSWAYLYENPALMRGLVGLELLGRQRIHELAHEIKNLTGQGLLVKRREVTAEILKLVQSGKFDISEEAKEEEQDDYINFLYRSPEHRTQFVQSFQAFLPHVFQYLSLMTHGHTMTDLVRMAKAGDDKAFWMAVQIDRTVLFDIPYFSQRLIQVQLGDERDFLKKLSNAMKGKILGHSFPHRKLWLVFAILEDQGSLNMPLDQLLDVCIDLGVHGGITDTNTFGKRRIAYISRKGN